MWAAQKLVANITRSNVEELKRITVCCHQFQHRLSLQIPNSVRKLSGLVEKHSARQPATACSHHQDLGAKLKLMLFDNPTAALGLELVGNTLKVTR